MGISPEKYTKPRSNITANKDQGIEYRKIASELSAAVNAVNAALDKATLQSTPRNEFESLLDRVGENINTLGLPLGQLTHGLKLGKDSSAETIQENLQENLTFLKSRDSFGEESNVLQQLETAISTTPPEFWNWVDQQKSRPGRAASA